MPFYRVYIFSNVKPRGFKNKEITCAAGMGHRGGGLGEVCVSEVGNVWHTLGALPLRALPKKVGSPTKTSFSQQKVVYSTNKAIVGVFKKKNSPQNPKMTPRGWPAVPKCRIADSAISKIAVRSSSRTSHWLKADLAFGTEKYDACFCT